MSSRLARLLGALIIGATSGTALSVGSAYAAACPSGTGVTVVVNSSVRCDGNGGGSAASNFRDAGHSLTMATRQPGFVCRVDGYPSSDPCVNASPTDAYWALFWANGKGGGWVYSNSGVESLSVPQGGWVAFKFQTSNSRSYPGVSPYTAPPAPAPKVTPKPVTRPKPKAPSKPSASASASASAAAKAKAKANAAKPSASASASASAAAAGELTNTSATTDSDGSEAMVWSGAVLAAALLAGMGVAIWRRRTAGRP